MATSRIYIISSDSAWAYRLSALVQEEGLGIATLFPMGKGALVAYRECLPDTVLFDLRQDRRDIAVALTMIREIFPRMARGGVVVIGHADPADRESVRHEREQLSRIQLAEYLPRNTPEDFLLERLHSLRQRAADYVVEAPERASAPPAAPAAPAPVRQAAPPPPVAEVAPAKPKGPSADVMIGGAGGPGEDGGWVPCMVKLLLSRPMEQLALLEDLADLGAELLDPVDARALAASGALPDFLLVDGGSAEQHASFLTTLRRQMPGLRIIQLPDEGDKALRRLSKDISALLMPAANSTVDHARVCETIRRRVRGQELTPTPVLLLVEDEQNIRELTAHYLLLQGYEVYQAEDGMEAMTVFRARPPDLILSDVYMPRMNGFKLLLEVKNWAPDLPMLMMTGYSSATQVLNTSKYRNVGFLPKPFRLSELGERIRDMLGTQP